jgi:hypothetical protein
VTARVATNDALPVNNARHATFLARERRKVLTVVDGGAEAGKEPWRAWQVALDVVGAFQCDVRTVAEAIKMKDLRSYPVVCLFEVGVADTDLWKRLSEYVNQGGGLVVVPGGEEWLPRVEDLNKASAELLPARWKTIVKVPPDKAAIPWAAFPAQHPLTNFFLVSSRNGADYGTAALRPSVYAYWATDLPKDSPRPLATFADAGPGAALLERVVGRGRVLQLTTPLDFRELDRNRRWINYWQESSFGVVLADQLCHYLAGDSLPPELNFLCGNPVVLNLGPAAAPPLILQGPNLVLAEANLRSPGPDGRLAVPQATAPGNYAVVDSKGSPVAAFSLNVHAEESRLDRVPAEEIEAVLGPGSLLQLGRAASLKTALEGLQPPPVEMLPWLMMVVLLVLAVESVLANKFYRRTTPAPEPARADETAAEGGAS